MNPPLRSTASEDAQAELTELRSALEQRDLEIESLQSRLASATARYREALLAAAPDVPEELVVRRIAGRGGDLSGRGAADGGEATRANRGPDCRRACSFRCAGKRGAGVQRHVVTGEDSLRPNPTGTGAVSLTPSFASAVLLVIARNQSNSAARTMPCSPRTAPRPSFPCLTQESREPWAALNTPAHPEQSRRKGCERGPL